MAAPQFLRTSYGDFYSSSALPVLEELFRSSLEQHPMIRDKVFSTKSTDKDIWQSSELHEMATFSSVSEGTDYTFDRPKQGYDKTLTVLKYGLGFSISEEAVDDGKFDMIASAVKFMARSAKETQETNAMNIFNNGFSSETAADGLAVFHAAHTTPTGTVTFRNKPSSAADLSLTSLETGLTDFMNIFKGDRGLYHHYKPKYLIVAPGEAINAQKLVGADKVPGSNYNDPNIAGQQGLQVLVSPLLTDADAWFLTAEPEMTGLRLIVRKPIETKASGPDVGFLNDAIYYKARFREILGVTHAYGIYGNAGA
jgi:hypothetical protein